MHKKLKNHGTVIKVAEAGQKIKLGESTWIEIIYAFDGINTPVGKTDINDLSLIMMLHHNKIRFLFTGDLNRKIGTYLSNTSDDISADVLKVPHHGTEGVAPNKFFKKVSPKYALVPAPKHLWQSKRSARIRNWFTSNHIPTFVNGISGDVYVAIHGDQLSVTSVKRINHK
jgi:competence protein ComEC